jgi:hypothetical protein
MAGQPELEHGLPALRRFFEDAFTRCSRRGGFFFLGITRSRNLRHPFIKAANPLTIGVRRNHRGLGRRLRDNRRHRRHRRRHRRHRGSRLRSALPAAGLHSRSMPVL